MSPSHVPDPAAATQTRCPGVDLAAASSLVYAQGVEPLFVTVSGAHLYGFPSPDSDLDLRGCHRLPLPALWSLDPPADETVERKLDLNGQEVELVSHDLGKYLRLLVKNNGYVLEQVFSPLVVTGAEFLSELRPLARRCVTRGHYHHYRGFLATQRRLLDKQQPKRLKAVLYAYRVVLTGTHLLQTWEVEAHLPTLAARYGLPDMPDLIAQKRTELAPAGDLDWAFHGARLRALEAELDRAHRESALPDDRDRAAANRFLLAHRLGAAG